jgi:hypothetical protein
MTTGKPNLMKSPRTVNYKSFVFFLMNTFCIIDLEHYNTPPFDFQKTL